MTRCQIIELVRLRLDQRFAQAPSAILVEWDDVETPGTVLRDNGYHVQELSCVDMAGAVMDDEDDLDEDMEDRPLDVLIDYTWDRVMNKTDTKTVMIVTDTDVLSEVDQEVRVMICQALKRRFQRVQSTGFPMHCMVVAVTENAGDAPKLFRDPEYFQRTIRSEPPSFEMRKEVIFNHLKNVHLSPLDESGDFTTRFASLSVSSNSLCDRYACLIANMTSSFSLRRLSELLLNATLLASDPSTPFSLSDLEPIIEVPKQVYVAGYDDIIESLDFWVHSITSPSPSPLFTTKSGGILFYGPNGCGKSLLLQYLTNVPSIRAISIEAYVSSYEILDSFRKNVVSKYLGETERNVRQIFKEARRSKPCFLVIDYLDSIIAKRNIADGEADQGVNERVLSTFLNELNGVEENDGVYLIGSTLRPDWIDDAMLRPGRLDRLIYVGLPSEKDRLEIFKLYTRDGGVQIASDVNLTELVNMTKDWTCADIVVFIRDAAFEVSEEDENATSVHFRHFEKVWSERNDRLVQRVHDMMDNLDPIYSRFRNKCNL